VIGTGKPGPFTARFLDAFHELAMNTGTPFNELKNNFDFPRNQGNFPHPDEM
jgi:hypothetical protein